MQLLHTNCVLQLSAKLLSLLYTVEKARFTKALARYCFRTIASKIHTKQSHSKIAVCSKKYKPSIQEKTLFARLKLLPKMSLATFWPQRRLASVGHVCAFLGYRIAVVCRANLQVLQILLPRQKKECNLYG